MTVFHFTALMGVDNYPLYYPEVWYNKHEKNLLNTIRVYRIIFFELQSVH